MKKLLSLTLALSLALSLTACGGSATSSVSTPAPSSTESSSRDELEALGDVEIEEELFDVTITLPADFNEGLTQEEIDETVNNGIFHSATLNEDGSVTYVMSKRQHKQLLKELSESLQNTLSEMPNSEEFPMITDVTANKDFTKFTVTISSDEVGLSESLAVFGFYMYGGIYGIFSGKAPDSVVVEFVNATSGEVLETFDSANAEN